jgi:pyridoxamine 5'-phosphate oxidase
LQIVREKILKRFLVAILAGLCKLPNMAIADLRRDYRTGGLDRSDLNADPLAQFQTWFNDAVAATDAQRADVNAMTLSTVDAAGQPSSRIVLLKGVDPRGFIFFTNYESRKGRELANNPKAALTFFWHELERQVCVAGTVSKVSRAEAETYFKSRPRASQLGAWASDQSSPVESRAALETKWREFEVKYPAEIPLPPYWGGYALNPHRIEFWQGRPSRLHDRFTYLRQADGSWKIERLAP